MRSIRLLGPAALLLLAHAGAAQELRSANSLATVERPRPGDALLPSSPAPAAPLRLEAGRTRPEGPRFLNRSLLATLGGTALGAWVGYFTSQMFKSDWDKRTDAEVVTFRTNFALGGAVIGGAGALLLGGQHRVVPPGDLATAGTPQADLHPVIALDEILQSGTSTVYELVQALHPEWLRVRGIKSFGEAGTAHLEGDRHIAVSPGEDRIYVYLDKARLGGPDELRRIAAGEVGSVHYFTQVQANYRWGVNKPVIQVILRQPKEV